ncbi:MAG: biopolymer transporter ExbD [Oceanospirillaceae bacterium]|nr:biopolymer transporter ExbD [Oceanospirillaceae bacterium]|tara:strand:+ start:2952 stop:3344 length:393 start_codon:yes stop_codon:yes gene_type:complete
MMPVIPTRRRTSGDDNLIPLINIVFLLLIFFMVAGRIQQQPDASLQVPAGSAAAEAQSLSVFVSLAADGTLTYRDEVVSPAALSEQLEHTGLKSISVVADRRATAAQLDDLLEVFRQRTDLAISLILEKP